MNNNNIFKKRMKLQNKNNSFILKINLVLELKQILLENPNRIKFLENTLIKIDELIKNINIKHTK